MIIWHSYFILVWYYMIMWYSGILVFDIVCWMVLDCIKFNCSKLDCVQFNFTKFILSRVQKTNCPINWTHSIHFQYIKSCFYVYDLLDT